MFGFTLKITDGRKKMRVIAAPCEKKEKRKKKKTMNAQGQVMVSLLSASFTQTNLKTASENILMSHACRAHTGQIDGMLWL